MKSAVLFMYLWSLAAGVNDKLLENLWDPYWPWFGPCIRQCTDPGINCLDVRKYSMPDSIMGRAGFSSMTPLKIYINVTFQAPAETIDICGEPRELTAVDPFTLHPDGLPYAEDLDRGAEIFRKQPSISWPALDEKLYTLIMLDVGYFKIKGWWIDIKKENGHLKGKVVVTYIPPSNPSTNINPILIVLFEHAHSTNPVFDMIDDCVISRGGIKEAVERCRNQFRSMYTSNNQMKLMGAQVYYTDGHSLFESQQACRESFPCKINCVSTYRRAVAVPTYDRVKPHLSDNTPRHLDHYIGVRFQSSSKICIDNEISKRINVRAIPEEQHAIDDRDTMNTLILEIGALQTDYLNASLLYSALIFYLAQPEEGGEDVVIGDIYKEHISLHAQNELSYGYRLCPSKSLQRFFVLLVSYTDRGTQRPCCTGKGKRWDISSFPPGVEIRGLTSFYIHKSEGDYCAHESPSRCNKRTPDYEIINNSTSEITQRQSEETRHELMCPLSTTTRKTRRTTTQLLVQTTTTEIVVTTSAAETPAPNPPAETPAPTPSSAKETTRPTPAIPGTTRRRATTPRRTTTTTTTAVSAASAATSKSEEVVTPAPSSSLTTTNSTEEETTAGEGARPRVGAEGAMGVFLMVLACVVVIKP